MNGQNFQHISHQKALEILRGSTHLSITVKSNLLGFKEMLAADRVDAGPSLISTGNGPVFHANPAIHGGAGSRLQSRAMTASAGIRVLHAENGRVPASPPVHHTSSYSSSAMATSMSKAMASSSHNGSHAQQPPAATKPEKETSKIGRLIKRIKHGSRYEY